MNPNALATNPNSLLTQAQSAKQALKVPTVAQDSGADFASRLRESKSRTAEKREPDPLTKPARTRERSKPAKSNNSAECTEADAPDPKSEPVQAAADQSAAKPLATTDKDAATAARAEISAEPQAESPEQPSADADAAPADEATPARKAKSNPPTDPADQAPEAGPAPAPPNINTLLRPLTISDLNRLLVRADQRVTSTTATRSTSDAPTRTAKPRAQSENTPDQPAPNDAQPVATTAPREFESTRVASSAPDATKSASRDDSSSARSTADAASSAPNDQPRDHNSAATSATSDFLNPSLTALTNKPASSLAAPTSETSESSASTTPLTALTGPTKSASTKIPARIFDLAQAAPSPARTETLDAQIGRGLSATLALKGGTVTLRLQPEALGQVRIHMKMDRSALGVRFEVGSSAARALLDEHLPALQRSLESQGFSIDKVSVHTDPALASTTKHDHAAHDAPAYSPADAGSQFNAGTDTRDEHSRNGGDRSFQGSAASEIAAADTTESLTIPSQGGVLDAITLRLNAVA